MRHCYATTQQAQSAQAAVMISQIRWQYEYTYGGIIEKGKPAYVIKLVKGTHKVTKQAYKQLGGLLRFETQEQASLFIYNYRELVIQYLLTF